GGRNRSSWRSSRGWLIGLPDSEPHAHPAFLQNRLLAQVKSSQSINRFLILHGRLIIGSKCCLRRAVIGGSRLRRNVTKLPWPKYRCQPFRRPVPQDVCGIGVKMGKNGTRY